tara:strand:+ start:140 stop:457 length:318 start_codon:yes stop_codon:yes gene_type:complete
MSKFYNIDGSTATTVELVSPSGANAIIKSVLLTNTSTSTAATVTLFIQDDPISGTTSTYNLIHKIYIPAGASLLLDEPSIFRFGEKYGLYVQVASTTTIDVIIST